MYDNKSRFGITNNNDINITNILLLSGSLFCKIFKFNKIEVINDTGYIKDNNKEESYDTPIRFIKDVVYLYIYYANLL